MLYNQYHLEHKLILVSKVLEPTNSKTIQTIKFNLLAQKFFDFFKDYHLVGLSMAMNNWISQFFVAKSSKPSFGIVSWLVVDKFLTPLSALKDRI